MASLPMETMYVSYSTTSPETGRRFALAMKFMSQPDLVFSTSRVHSVGCLYWMIEAVPWIEKLQRVNLDWTYGFKTTGGPSSSGEKR